MDAEVLSIQINCLVDTGETISVIHEDKYYAIPTNLCLPLQKTEGDIVMGNGSTVKATGIATFPLKFHEHLTISFPMVIAKLEVPGVLGYDFLYANNGIVDVRNSKVTLNEQTLKCQLESRLPSLFRITASNTVSIPPQSEIMTTGVITSETELSTCKSAILESTPHLLEKKQDYF